ncbi:hypothetical protein J3B02_001030 [Coemansia erecta]|uniref:mRNA m(6)A methyltransferase n=1 Tax=Coemansia asiatica TaxID=1052880 RepID=A0A9W7XL58_9FUNG|nr:hypothetical protein LPJ64_001512 [Coemansia asiatica]KAJ2857401.1 hypothetical protein J3B02_001030 [Coemansia erecta]KAJ2879768.1 hypothetical protein FB639_003003 [Coemansia asiatica]
MWSDEVYFEDDEAAMAAYRAAVDEAGSASNNNNSNDDDDDENDDDSDNDFIPEKPSRRSAKTKSRRELPPKSKKISSVPRKASLTKPRKPRATAVSRSSSPAPIAAALKTADNTDEDGDIDVDIDIEGLNDSSLTAMPTPDIGKLSMSAASGADESSSPSTMLESLREREQNISERILQLEREIADLEKKCGVEGATETKAKTTEIDLSEFKAPEWSVPIRANVMNFDWEKLASACQFDVILMDPPWQLASQAPTRGVAIAYQQLPDVCIESLPIQLLQTSGFIFIWVINNKYTKAFQLMKQWGYTYVDDIAWVKQTVNRRMAKGHGYYLQHAKETCLVGKKGADPPNLQRSVASDVIFSERRGQSQKPEEMYEIIEQLIPGGRYLEIFGRKNNLRDYWVTIGNEL